MVREFQGKTLEEAYENASQSLQCSITDLQIDIIQAPSKGFLGFFAKDAIISATISKEKKYPKKHHQEQHNERKNTNTETLTSKLNALRDDEPTIQNTSIKQIEKEEIFSDFYSNETQILHKTPKINKANQEIIKEIKEQVQNLFSKTCYQIDEIQVDIIDEGKTVYIEFNGEDSALLIGKEGYRYKALSYILFNWINDKYNMMLRLEIAQFLENQEQAIHTYLEPVIQVIETEGFYKTKPLDGILIHIALTKLRDEFPNKYVAVKTNIKGDKYILVNEYRSH
jgi:spoIIIJ-associated protein